MASSSTTMPAMYQISQEEFNLFHSIDRRLFTILVFTLGRDPNHATRIMALWLWLEKLTSKSTIVHAILTLPYPTIEDLFDESMLCLHVAAFGPTVKDHIPVLQALLHGRNLHISLAYFHENKAMVLTGVGRIVQDVCYRAFQDIVAMWKAQGDGSQQARPGPSHVPVEETGLRQRGVEFNPYFRNQSHVGYDENNEPSFNLQEELDEMYSKMNCVNLEVNRREEERFGEGREHRGRGSNNKTLFLTFSKGYPISKTEVRDFFTRFFGDIIEGLHMQDVPKNEQPLYARLVTREASMVDLVLQGERKVKFSINGKHACVRKYVRRRSESPPSPSAGDS